MSPGHQGLAGFGPPGPGVHGLWPPASFVTETPHEDATSAARRPMSRLLVPVSRQASARRASGTMACGGRCMGGGVRRSRLWPRGLWQLQRRSHDAGDEGSIGLAAVAGLDALKQRHPLLPVQGDAETVFEPCEPWPHRGGRRRPARAPRLRLGICWNGCTSRAFRKFVTSYFGICSTAQVAVGRAYLYRMAKLTYHGLTKRCTSLRWRRASIWPASQASPGGRGPLGRHESSLF